jgi:exopolysaccharide production protein ExoZ
MQHFTSIHYLRGFAAMMVAVFHIFSSIDFMRVDVLHVMWLRGGVDIFFVISGFVMVQSTKDRDITSMKFIRQRALRIVPMYWIATCALIAQIKGEWFFKLKSLLFIPAVNPESGMMQPVLEPGWTLNYEMFFYAVFALTLLLRSSFRFAAIALFFAGLILIGAANDGGPMTEFYTRAIILEFVLGMAIAQFGVRLPILAVPVGIGIMIACQYSALDRVFALGIPAGLIIAGALRFEDRLPKWKVADLLGSASYSIYLFHLIALGFLVYIWPDAEASKALFAVAAFAFMLLVGCGVYLVLERPLMAILTGLVRKQKPERLAPAC